MNSMMRDLANGIEPDEAVDREWLRYAIQRQITCPQSGRVLDIRRAVLVKVTAPDGKESAAAYDAEWFDTVRETVEASIAEHGLTLTVMDSRTWKGARK